MKDDIRQFFLCVWQERVEEEKKTKKTQSTHWSGVILQWEPDRGQISGPKQSGPK